MPPAKTYGMTENEGHLALDASSPITAGKKRVLLPRPALLRSKKGNATSPRAEDLSRPEVEVVFENGKKKKDSILFSDFLTENNERRHLALDTSVPIKIKKRTLLSPPGFLRFKGKQQEARETNSSPRTEGDTTGRTKVLSQGNVKPCNKEKGKAGGENVKAEEAEQSDFALHASVPDNNKKRTLFSPAAFLRYKRNQQKRRESRSSPRAEDVSRPEVEVVYMNGKDGKHSILSSDFVTENNVGTVNNNKRTLLSPPGFLRFKGKQQEARETSSSPRTEFDTTGRTIALSQENVKPCNQEKNESGGENCDEMNPTLAAYIIISVDVFKPTKETKTGISISQKSGGNKITISEITEGGLFDSSDLRVGDEIMSINSIPTHGLLVRDLATMIAEMVGSVSILARRQLNKVKKRPLFRNRKVAFAPSVLGGKTESKIGVRSAAINRSPPMEQDATYVTIAANVVKPTKETKTGVSINQGADQMIKISEITKGGLLDSSGLEVGDEVISINNVETKGLLVKDVAVMIGGIAGSVRILVRRRLETTEKEMEIDTPKPEVDVLQNVSQEVVRPPITNEDSADGASVISGDTSEDLDCETETDTSEPQFLFKQKEWTDDSSEDAIRFSPPMEDQHYETNSLICESTSQSQVPFEQHVSPQGENGNNDLKIVDHPHTENESALQELEAESYGGLNYTFSHQSAKDEASLATSVSSVTLLTAPIESGEVADGYDSDFSC